MIDLRDYLYESLVLEADNSWGEIFESIICNSWNSKGKSVDDAETGSRYASIIKGHGLDPKTIAKNIYDTLKDSKIIPEKETLHKLDAANTTDEWFELGMYTKKPNATPKTDIISTKNNKVRISVKEESGARLMSGAINETIATLRVAVNKSGNKELKELVDNTCKQLTEDHIFRGTIKGSTKSILRKLGQRPDSENPPEDESERIVWQIEQAKNILAGLIEKIKSFPDVYKEVLHEAISGMVKFGVDPGCANYVLTWDKDGNCNIYNIDDYIKEFGSQYKVYATYKSSSKKSASNNVDGIDGKERNTWMVMTLSN